jgi:hypothetical protein
MPDGLQRVGERRHRSAARAAWQRLTGSLFGRDLTFVLTLKVALVVLLYLFLFRPALHPAKDPAATAAAVAGATADAVNEVHR